MIIFSEKNINILYFLLVSLFFSCNDEKFKGYSVNEHGLYYKLHTLGAQEMYPKVGDLLTVLVVFKTDKDSIIHQSAKKIILSSSPYQGSLEDGLLSLSLGDSASFKLFADSFYIKGLNQLLPSYIIAGSYLTVGVKITDIRSLNDDYPLNKNFIDAYEYKDMDELTILANYLTENHIDVQATSSGLYFINENKTNGKMPLNGHGVKINYEGSFLDGQLFDSTTEKNAPFEFVLGVKDQVIPGIEQALYRMHEGEKAKIIVPSFLAFGEKGSSTGIIPPYTPVVYEIELLQVN